MQKNRSTRDVESLKKIMALITARGGSKGIPRKSVCLLAGKPLINYTIEAALQSQYCLRMVVSTDDEEIAEVARTAGAEAPFLRPPALARDETPTFSVVRHALEWLEQHDGYKPELVVVLQPTSPLRRAEHIDRGIKLLLQTDALTNSQSRYLHSLVSSFQAA